MNVNRAFKAAIALELITLATIVSGIIMLDSSQARAWRLFELLGANMASLITTFGVYKMRQMT